MAVETIATLFQKQLFMRFSHNGSGAPPGKRVRGLFNHNHQTNSMHTATIHYIEHIEYKGPSDLARSLVYQANMFEAKLNDIVHRSVKVDFSSSKPVESLKDLHQLLPSIFPNGSQFQIQYQNQIITP